MHTEKIVPLKEKESIYCTNIPLNQNGFEDAIINSIDDVERIVNSLEVIDLSDYNHLSENSKYYSFIIPDNCHFEKYISFTKSFVYSIKDLIFLIKNYSNRVNKTRPLNIFLIAPPGNGKSFLCKQISRCQKEIPISFSEFQISSLNNYSDFYSFLVNIQSQIIEDKLPFVLFDEIDAKVEGKTIFNNLLPLMNDGAFFYGSQKINIFKAVFFFAASQAFDFNQLNENNNTITTYDEWAGKLISNYKTNPQKIITDKYKYDTKIVDFLDRIDYFIIVPPINKAFLDRDIEQENFALSISFIKKYFPDIEYIEIPVISVLKSFIKNCLSYRDIEKIIFLSTWRNPNNKAFFTSFLPNDLLSNIKYLAKNNKKINKHISDYKNKFIMIKEK